MKRRQPGQNGSKHAAHGKRGPASLPAPVSPDFGLSIPRDRWGLVSAACSARAGKGMRASRRSSRPVASAPEGASTPGPRRPASVLPGAASKPCWTPLPDHPVASVRLAPSIRPWLSSPLSRRFRPILRLFLRLRFGVRFASDHRSIPSWFPSDRPRAISLLPGRVSRWLCSGFPRRHRLLTVMKLSLNRRSGKGENSPEAC